MMNIIPIYTHNLIFKELSNLYREVFGNINSDSECVCKSDDDMRKLVEYYAFKWNITDVTEIAYQLRYANLQKIVHNAMEAYFKQYHDSNNKVDQIQRRKSVYELLSTSFASNMYSEVEIKNMVKTYTIQIQQYNNNMKSFAIDRYDRFEDSPVFEIYTSQGSKNIPIGLTLKEVFKLSQQISLLLFKSTSIVNVHNALIFIKDYVLKIHPCFQWGYYNTDNIEIDETVWTMIHNVLKTKAEVFVASLKQNSITTDQLIEEYAYYIVVDSFRSQLIHKVGVTTRPTYEKPQQEVKQPEPEPRRQTKQPKLKQQKQQEQPKNGLDKFADIILNRISDDVVNAIVKKFEQE